MYPTLFFPIIEGEKCQRVKVYPYPKGGRREREGGEGGERREGGVGGKSGYQDDL